MSILFYFSLLSNIIFQLTQLAFETLGDNGHMPLASDHTCSDCTKPYEAGPDENEEDVQDILKEQDTEVQSEKLYQRECVLHT